MIIAITAVDGSLQSPVEARFGRAPFFMIANTETQEVFAHDNAEGVNASNGAGTGAAQTLSEYKVDVLYTGRVGPKAAEVLQKAGIEYREETTGTVAEVLHAASKEFPAPAPASIQSTPVAAPEAELDALQKGAIRVAVPANNDQGLWATRSGHFGHCAFYSLVDVYDNQIVNIQSRPNGGHVQGGCMAPVNLLKSWGVSVVVVSGIGGRPLQGFREQGMEVYGGLGDTVEDAVQSFIRGEVAPFGNDQVCGGGAH